MSIWSSSSTDSNFIEADPNMIPRPYPNAYFLEEITQGLRNSFRREHQPLIATERPEIEMVALHRISSGPTPATARLRSRPAVPVPAGLSGKELAWLRATARASGLPRLSHTHSSPNLSNIGSTSSPANVVTERGEGGSSFNTQGPHSDLESLRQEMVRLRLQGEIIEAPPSYTEDG